VDGEACSALQIYELSNAISNCISDIISDGISYAISDGISDGNSKCSTNGVAKPSTTARCT